MTRQSSPALEMGRQFRLARPSEVTALPDIERAAGETFRGSSHDWIADDAVSPAEFHRPLAEAGLVWVAEVDSRLAGFLTAELFDGSLHIWELAVSPSHQGQGLGRGLVQTAILAARTQGVTAVTLTTFSDIAWNAPFYERLGFRRLAAHETSERLLTSLEKEAARGLTNRCAMLLAL